jgi:peptidoglycan/xylan/chitin deacetylase (PgdA/CDA1 family)
MGKRKIVKGIVLYYHSIPDASRSKFKRQMEVLMRHAVTCSLDRPITDQAKNPVAITFDDGFVSVFKNAIPAMVQLNMPCIIFIPSLNLGNRPSWIQNRSHGDFSESIISIEELARLDNSLIKIGSHCRTHRNLLELSLQEAKEEIVESKRELEKILGKEVAYLSFPHGAFNDDHVKIAREAGYKRVFSIEPSRAQLNGADYVVGRVRVDSADLDLEFRLKISGAYSWMPFVSRRKAKIVSYFKRKSKIDIICKVKLLK